MTNQKQSILSAVMDALAAHTVMSNQALDCQRIRDGFKEILLGQHDCMRGGGSEPVVVVLLGLFKFHWQSDGGMS